MIFAITSIQQVWADINGLYRYEHGPASSYRALFRAVTVRGRLWDAFDRSHYSSWPGTLRVTPLRETPPYIRRVIETRGTILMRQYMPNVAIAYRCRPWHGAVTAPLAEMILEANLFISSRRSSLLHRNPCQARSACLIAELRNKEEVLADIFNITISRHAAKNCGCDGA